MYYSPDFCALTSSLINLHFADSQRRIWFGRGKVNYFFSFCAIFGLPHIVHSWYLHHWADLNAFVVIALSQILLQHLLHALLYPFWKLVQLIKCYQASWAEAFAPSGTLSRTDTDHLAIVRRVANYLLDGNMHVRHIYIFAKFDRVIEITSRWLLSLGRTNVTTDDTVAILWLNNQLDSHIILISIGMAILGDSPTSSLACS